MIIADRKNFIIYIPTCSKENKGLLSNTEKKKNLHFTYFCTL